MPDLRHTITVDFSGDNTQGVAGIALIVQESVRPGRRGAVLAEYQEAVRGLAFEHGEKYAVLRALEIGIERGIRDLKVRSDYNAMRRGLKRRHNDARLPAGDHLDERILHLTAQFDRIHFGFVPRRKNQRAHTLSRAACAMPAQEWSWP